jgi:photosystem II stability/assembly factor-like uncharacterized protein
MKKIILVLILSGFIQSQNFWQQTNGPLGGSTGGIAENSMNELFIGATYYNPTKVFKSINNGQRWFDTYNGVQGVEPEVMVIGYDDYIFFSGYATSIVRSTNNGESWQQYIIPWPNNDIYELHVASNNYVFAGIAGFPSISILLSTNNGDSWEDKSVPINTNVYAIASFQNKVFTGTSGNGVYYSTNYGNSWTQSSLDTNYIASLAVSSSGNVFAGTFSGLIYKSADSGGNWDILHGIWGYECVSTIMTQVPGYIFVGLGRWLSLSSGEAIFRSTDEGETWTLVNNGIYTSAGIVELISTSNGYIYATTADNGTFRTSDYGDSWEQVGPIISNVMDVAIDDVGNIFAGTYYTVYCSTNGGFSWELKSNGIDNDIITVITATKNGDIWGGSTNYNGGLYHSTNKGENWTKISGFGLIYSVDDNNAGEIFVATATNLMCSTDNGASWQVKHNQAYGRLFITESNEIYFGHRFGLEVSTDNGNNWTEILQTNFIEEIFVDNKNNIFASSDAGLLRSSDSGLSWDTVSSDFITPYVTSITGNSTNQLYCTVRTNSGPVQYAYYASYDDGIIWVDISEDMPSPGTSLAMDTSGYLYCGTEYTGVYRSSSPTTGITIESEKKLSYLLEQNYPNPFNPTTKIKFTIPSVETTRRVVFTTLKVYDILGNEIATLVNEELSAGEYEVEFGASSGSSFRLVRNLTSGIYFYTLRAGDFIQTKKMVVIK